MARIYLDANIVIYYIERHPVLFPQIKTVMLAPIQLAEFVVSDLVRLETRVFPLRHRDTSLLARFDAFFDTPNVRPALMDRQVFDLATALRAEHRLKTPDALHLAAAIQSGCDAFWTNDHRLSNAAQNRLQILVFESTS